MAIVELMSGRIIEDVRLTNVEDATDDGDKQAIAHIDGKEYLVYSLDGLKWEEVVFHYYSRIQFVDEDCAQFSPAIRANDDDPYSRSIRKKEVWFRSKIKIGRLFSSYYEESEGFVEATWDEVSQGFPSWWK